MLKPMLYDQYKSDQCNQESQPFGCLSNTIFHIKGKNNEGLVTEGTTTYAMVEILLMIQGRNEMEDAHKEMLASLHAEAAADQEELRSQYERELERGIEAALTAAREQWSQVSDGFLKLILFSDKYYERMSHIIRIYT